MTDNFYSLCYRLLEPRKEYVHSEFTDSSTRNYFEKSMNEIHAFLQSKYSNDYLFSSIAYEHDYRVKAPPYRFNQSGIKGISNQVCGEYMKDLINYLTQNLINEKNHLSFTQIMLSEQNQENPIKILLYEGKSYEESGIYIPLDIVMFDLSQPKWDKIDNIEKFKLVDFGSYDYGFPLHNRFVNQYGNPFLKIVGQSPPPEIVEEFNRLISIYLEINACFEGNNYFYFIKPQVSHTEFNGVLLLALKQPIAGDDFTMWTHIFHRLLSEISIKKIQKIAEQKESLRYLTSSNYTVHFYKTIIPGLMNSPLSSLEGKYPDDEDVRKLNEGKKLVEKLSAIGNLITKIVEEQQISQDELVKSELFSASTENIDLQKIFSTIESNLSNNDRKIHFERNNVSELIPLIKYGELSATYGFYLLYFLTLAENAFYYGIPDYNTEEVKLHLYLDKEQSEFIAYNTPRNKEPAPAKTDIKGNIKLFDIILTKANIGTVFFRKQLIDSEEYFVTVLKLNRDEK